MIDFWMSMSMDGFRIYAAQPEIRLGRGKVRSADGERVTVDLPGYGYLWMQT